LITYFFVNESQFQGNDCPFCLTKGGERLNRKVLGTAVVLISVVMLASALSTVEACGCRRRKPKIIDFVFYIEDVGRVDNNVRCA
jgi:hypothetical protein